MENKQIYQELVHSSETAIPQECDDLDCGRSWCKESREKQKWVALRSFGGTCSVATRLATKPRTVLIRARKVVETNWKATMDWSATPVEKVGTRQPTVAETKAMLASKHPKYARRGWEPGGRWGHPNAPTTSDFPSVQAMLLDPNVWIAEKGATAQQYIWPAASKHQVIINMTK